MSAPVAVLVLLGLVGVPVALLWTGQHFRGYPPKALGAWRGGLVGYLLSCTVVAVVLLVPPFTWPPSVPWVRLLLVGGLLVGPILGAAAGAWRGADRG